MTQTQHFWKSHLEQAAINHDKMAQLHERSGNTRLAAAARETALSRRIAADHMKGFVTIGEALDYAEAVLNKINDTSIQRQN